MGAFDYLRCKYPLPLEGANERVYQTKDTKQQFLEDYELREDGTLWWQDIRTKEWTREPPFTGEIQFAANKSSRRRGALMTQSPTSERIRLADEMRDEYCLMDTIDLSEWCREAMEQLRADEADIAELSIEFDEALAEVGRLNLMLMQHEAEIADLRARLAEAEKGAKRYAWLRDTSRCDQQDAGVDLSWYGPNDADFDGLIDQAMQRSD